MVSYIAHACFSSLTSVLAAWHPIPPLPAAGEAGSTTTLPALLWWLPLKQPCYWMQVKPNATARMNYIWTASMYIYVCIHTYICTSTYKGNPPTISQTRHAQHIPCWQAFVSLLCSHMYVEAIIEHIDHLLNNNWANLCSSWASSMLSSPYTTSTTSTLLRQCSAAKTNSPVHYQLIKEDVTLCMQWSSSASPLLYTVYICIYQPHHRHIFADNNVIIII